jgi:uncharacterized protein (TIGR02246 family)
MQQRLAIFLATNQHGWTALQGEAEAPAKLAQRAGDILRLGMNSPYKSDEQAIRNLMETWVRATAAGDLQTVLTLMSDDAVFLVPGQPPMQGKNAFASTFQAVTSVARIEAVSDTQKIQVEGDFAWCWNHLSLTITPRNGGQPLRRAGYTLSVLRREPGGNWVVIHDTNLLPPD